METVFTKHNAIKRSLAAFLTLVMLVLALSAAMSAVKVSAATGDVTGYDGYYKGFYYRYTEDKKGIIILIISKDAIGADHKVNIPTAADNKHVVEIADSAFYGLISTDLLKSTDYTVVFPQYLEKIGTAAFYGCSSIETLDFSNCRNLKEIGSAAFYGCTSLKKVVGLPDTLEYIPSHLFYGCTELSEINMTGYGASAVSSLPKNISSIGQYAFYTCSSLTSLVVPTTVEAIDICAFSGCYNLKGSDIGGSTGIAFGKGLKSLGSGAFNGCFSLESFKVDPENSKYYTDKYGIIYNKSGTDLLLYPAGRETDTTVTLPKTVTTIGDNAFRGAGIRSIVLPDGLKTIGIGAFADCVYLNEITVPDSVTEIGSFAFSISNSTLSDLVAKYQNKDDTYEYISGLIHIDLPKTIEKMGSYVFMNDYELSGVVLPENLEKIPVGTFYNCTNLRDVTIPDTCREIGAYAFYKCLYAGVNTVLDDEGNEFYNYSGIDLKNVEKIGSYAFYKNENLISIKADNLIEVGLFAFRESAITSLDLSKCERLLGGAFYSCAFLDNVELSENLNTISNYAFNGCSKLSSIKLGSKLISIGNYAFAGTGLTGIDLPDTLETIGVGAFSGSKLEEIVLPASITYIPDFTFYAAAKLAKVEFEGEITYIGSSAFNACASLTSIDIPDSVTTLGSCAFSDTGIQHFTSGAGLKVIEFKAFYNCRKLLDCDLTDAKSLKTIGEQAFQNCTALTRVKLPESVTDIMASAFEDCVSLVGIDLPEGLLHVGDAAFRDCIELTYTEFPSKVCYIGIDSFTGTKFIDEQKAKATAGNNMVILGDGVLVLYTGSDQSVTSVTIPASVKYICYEAFAYKYFIKQLHFENSENLRFISSGAFIGVYQAASSKDSLVLYGKDYTYPQYYADRYGFTFKSEK